MSKLFQELKRRNVFKETIAYLVFAWLILQVVSVILPIWNTPAWVLQIITITLGLGLPIWIIFSWHYQITSSGIIKTKTIDGHAASSKGNRVLNLVIMGALAAIIALIWLRPSTITSVSADKLSIAVLPFTNMSDDQSNDWFSIGVTEDILTHLSKVNGLRVISRTSVMQFRNSDKSVPEIAKELDVAYIVEGSVRKQDNQVLITAQLLKANDEHLWAANYSEDLIDAFKIQQEVSQKIVNQLKIYVSPQEKEALNQATTTNAMAMELFTRGRTIGDNRTQEDLERSIDLYKEAIKLDPQFAEAYAEIANSFMLLNIYGYLNGEDSFEKAEIYIDKALEIDANISRAYSVKAMLDIRTENWDMAKINFEKAIEINPNDATAHHHFAIYWRDCPQPNAQKLLEHITEAQRLDPLSRPVSQTRFWALLTHDKIEEAKTHFEKTRFVYSPEEIIYYQGIINSAIHKDLTELIYSFERALKDDPDNLDLLRTISDHHYRITLDRSKSLDYSKRMFEVDSSKSTYMEDKFYHLIDNKKFKEAEIMLNDTELMESLNPFTKIAMHLDFYAFQKDYGIAVSYLEQLKPLHLQSYYYKKASLFALMGDAKSTYEVINQPDYKPGDLIKAYIFMNLNETDSLFHYLSKISNYAKMDSRMYTLMKINGSYDMDPYRNDPRYLEIMKKNYFPLKVELAD